MPTRPRFLGVIPARWASTRFPGKPLQGISGKPMVQWVYESAKGAQSLSEVLVATDDQRIFEAVIAFGGKVVMTSPDHVTGTDRVAEVSAQYDYDVVVNIQGDEPFIPSENIDRVVQPFLEGEDIAVSTLKIPVQDEKDALDPNIVKVVCDKNGFALYFSRSPIPYRRDSGDNHSVGFQHMDQHIGLYAYSKKFLNQLSSLSPSPLEKAEKLEQLRFLENGIAIKVMKADKISFGIDCPEDLKKAELYLKETV